MYEYIRKNGLRTGIVIIDKFKLDPREVDCYKYGRLFNVYDKRLCRGEPFPGEDVEALRKAIPFKKGEYCVFYWRTENKNSYVGMSKDVSTELHEHIYHQVKYWDRIIYIEIGKVKNKLDAEKLKQFLIEDLKPTLSHVSGRINYKYYQEHPVPKPKDFDEILKRLALAPVLDTKRLT